MIDYIAIYLFGAITIAIPLLIWYLRKEGLGYIQECKKTRQNLEDTLFSLNQLHNNAMTTNKSLENRVTKLETTIAAQNYGVSKR